MTARRVVAILITTMLLGVGLAGDAYAQTHDVTVGDNLFSPDVIKIQPGDTVRWTATRPGHTVTARDGQFDFHPGRTLNAGEQVSATLVDEEYVRYYCRIHAGMEGLIQVGDPPVEPVPPGPTLIVPDQVASITAAAAAAAPGTEILVRPGTYAEEVAIATRGVSVRGLGALPGDVVLAGEGRRRTGVTVSARGVSITNLSVTGYERAGVAVVGASGTVVANAVLDSNGLYGIDARGPTGLTVRDVHATGHGVAGIGVRDCTSCGALIDGARVESNAAGVVAANVAGIVVRNSTVRDNASGVVLRDVAGAQVTGNTVGDNAATDVWVASVFDQSELPSGVGVWVNGGTANLVASNTVSGHTYNVAVTGALTRAHRIVDNTFDRATFADLGVDALGMGTCLSGNRSAAGTDPTSHPPSVQTVYGCRLATTAVVPFPIVTANLVGHSRER